MRRIIFDPAAGTVTHLVIEEKHQVPGRLVPLDLVDSTAGEIRLRCTIAEFGALDPAEERDLVEGRGAGIETAPGGAPMGIPHLARTTVEDVVPLGAAEASPGDHVHALDGGIGEVQGFLVDPDDDTVTHVLSRRGICGAKEVAIPVSAVAGTTEGIRLNLTKKQVEDLPPVG